MSRGTPKQNGDFYPRPPRGGRRAAGKSAFQRGEISIHALREEGDRFGQRGRHRSDYFYPRPPRGGRPAQVAGKGLRVLISIHALREEGDSGSAS